MESFPPDRIRNVALVGRSGSGKTTLSETLLFVAGAISRRGKVEDGTTVADSEPEEQRRGSSLSTAVLPFKWQGHKINLLDTPGYPDFSAEVDAALRVVDLAVFVVSAADGLDAHTEMLWQRASELGLPRLIFVNKVDRERSDFSRTLDELGERFGAGVAPLELPIGQEANFRGVADLLTDRAWHYVDGKRNEGDMPDDMGALEHQVHDALVEGIVVADDAMLEAYLEGEVPTPEQLEHTMAAGVAAATVFPVICGSATTVVAIDRLADFICELGPSPLDRPPVEVRAGDTTADVAPDPNGPPLAFVFKTVADQFVGHLSIFKVLSGRVRPDDHLVNSRTGEELRLHALLGVRGHNQEAVTEAVAGDIAAVAKLATTDTGDTLTPKGMPVRVDPIRYPEPLLALAIAPASKADDEKLSTALHRLLEEDPSLQVERVEETHQTLLRGVGEAHLSVTLERLERRFGVSVETDQPQVPFRQTISATADVLAKHHKQSGGHGQFADCAIRIEPRERGAGFEFVNKIVGGAISKGYIPAVEKGIVDGMSEGAGLGYPVVDLRVELVDGKEHPVDSSEMAFREVGRIAIRDAIAKAGPVLLEPISNVVVMVPSDLQGAVMADLNGRRGRILGSESLGPGQQVVTALVPDAELVRYPIDLRSLTGGRGSFTRRHDRYDVAPPNGEHG